MFEIEPILTNTFVLRDYLNQDIDVGWDLVNKNTLFCLSRAKTKLLLKPDQHPSSAAKECYQPENHSDQIIWINYFWCKYG